MRIALLSNINMNGTIKHLNSHINIYRSEGYGNELGTLINQNSSIYEFKPDIIFIIDDLLELLKHDFNIDNAEKRINDWFTTFSAAIKPEITYYISDAYLFGKELNIFVDKGVKIRLEECWQKALEKISAQNSNVRIFPYRNIIETTGESLSFSMKMWYMGKILHSSVMQQRISEEIIYLTNIETRIPKKVLALDLDNTLWGGLAGEHDITPITLSDDHLGLAFKNLQRIILSMKEQGVLLVIISKNNESDVLTLIENHPHMVLKLKDFADIKINWKNKAENLKEIAKELNLGLDSFVFFDDNATERQLITDMLPDVAVPKFPDNPEDLVDSMVEIWNVYFSKPIITQEDKNKTKQYKENAERELLKKNTLNFEDYLNGLDIVLCRKSEADNIERITQLLNKTNQFNLTTKRHTTNDIQNILSDKKSKIFVYQASDKFGDYGIIAVAITHIISTTLYIEEFVMSCRVMGKNIENAIIDDIENWAEKHGCTTVYGKYIETQKNQPVKNLYLNLGYIPNNNILGSNEFELSLKQKKQRNYQLKRLIDSD